MFFAFDAVLRCFYILQRTWRRLRADVTTLRRLRDAIYFDENIRATLSARPVMFADAADLS